MKKGNLIVTKKELIKRIKNGEELRDILLSMGDFKDVPLEDDTSVEDIKEYRYDNWRDDLPTKEAYNEYVKDDRFTVSQNRSIRVFRNGISTGKKKVLDDLEKYLNEYSKYIKGEPCETCLRNVKEKINSMRIKQ